MSAKKFLLYISQNYSFAILRPLQTAIKARGDEVKWFVKGNDVNLDFFKDDEHCLPSVDDIMAFKPDAIFVPGNIIPDFLPGLKVAVFHGFNVEKRSDSRGHFNIRGCFDLYCTQGPNTTKPFQELAKQHEFFSVAETGWPAVDSLHDYQPQQNKKPVVLMCSTFSKQLSCAPHLFEQVKKLSASGRWQWLVQFHPKMDSAVVEKYKSIQSEHLTFVETDNVLPLLQQADVMLCDTSSVLLMFLLLSKPVVTFKNSNPKDYLVDFEQADLLEEKIAFALTKPTYLMEKITEFQRQTHPYNDGKSAERVLGAVDERLAGSHQPVKAKPLNLIRTFKARKRLKYWKFW
ncbi:CDP-glycerol--glycerophosphate glycerophosphotransferase [Thalassotalea sp. M1531]|uniref:CDP-glycerol--glycerophosphate glycerophosphotransferase n=1 Tax=Thalassotalea algicola TaxID=2716224 RepID=A0A7Y0Q7I2_9GAMM|nr:CDP-glycerol glycerophosphotransferase family protein [Thalassotalea algicola]NMP32241.1 CDP-glycerol--glycerophosphate glycerophosphotransferase [Thalassotalea algicola]